MELTLENAKIFATYPRDGVTILQALATSMIGTALMVHSIFGVNDAKNTSKPQEKVSKSKVKGPKDSKWTSAHINFYPSGPCILNLTSL